MCGALIETKARKISLIVGDIEILTTFILLEYAEDKILTWVSDDKTREIMIEIPLNRISLFKLSIKKGFYIFKIIKENI